MSRAWEYIMSAGGIASEAAYNFTGTGGPHSPPPPVPPVPRRLSKEVAAFRVLSLMRLAGTCKHEPEVATVSSAVNISYGDLAGLTAAVATQGPVSVVSHPQPSHSSLFEPSLCTTRSSRTNAFVSEARCRMDGRRSM